MHCDSPPPSWYEPLDVFEDDEPEVAPPADDLVVAGGAGSWFSTLAHDDSDD
jgi:hypothetical protein